MTVATLCYAPTKSSPMVVAQQFEVVAGSGIVGDHFFSSRPRHPGQNLTLIEAEEVEAFNARAGTQLASTDPRRNVVTRGVRLNDLVGKTFTIGTATLRGVELCEPCKTLARYLAGPRMSAAEFIHAFKHRCGLRADVIASGTIRIGDPLVIGEDAPG
jgi:MOSC domain-containing protein YiiM